MFKCFLFGVYIPPVLSLSPSHVYTSGHAACACRVPFCANCTSTFSENLITLWTWSSAWRLTSGACEIVGTPCNWRLCRSKWPPEPSKEWDRSAERTANGTSRESIEAVFVAACKTANQHGEESCHGMFRWPKEVLHLQFCSAISMCAPDCTQAHPLLLDLPVLILHSHPPLESGKKFAEHVHSVSGSVHSEFAGHVEGQLGSAR